MLFQVCDETSLWEAIRGLSESEERAVISFAEGGDIALTKELPAIVSRKGLCIEGNQAHIHGAKEYDGIVVEGQDISIENLRISQFNTGIFIRSQEMNTKNVFVKNCEFSEIQSACVMTGITNSNLTIDGVAIENNRFEAPSSESGSHTAGHVACATSLFNALYRTSDHPIHDAVLSNVVWRGNHTLANQKDGNQFSEGLMAHGACNYGFFDGSDISQSSLNEVYNCKLVNLTVEDNIVDGVHDIGMTFLASFPGRHDNVLENVAIRGNRITYFNTGINVGATNQCGKGDVARMYARNIRIEKNTLIAQIPGPFEPQIGIMLFTTRSESQEQRCLDSHMEDVIVRENHISGHEVGIQVEAQHGTQELPYPSNISGCTIDRLTIEKNVIKGAQHAIKMSAVHMEGRVDDFWGYPVPPYDAEKGYSTLAEGNRINHVKIVENEIIEYDIALVVQGAWGCNHTLSKNNIIGPDYEIHGNRLDGGRKIFCYSKYKTDQVMYGDAIGFGNRVIGDWDME